MSKWYVVDVQKICIDSGWDDVAPANRRAVELRREGGVPKVMTQPRVGAQVLDPKDRASWTPKRNNPSDHGTVRIEDRGRGKGRRHGSDADCDVDPETDACRQCGVHHGEACDSCGGRGFHEPDCSALNGGAHEHARRNPEDMQATFARLQRLARTGSPAERTEAKRQIKAMEQGARGGRATEKPLYAIKVAGKYLQVGDKVHFQGDVFAVVSVNGPKRGALSFGARSSKGGPLVDISCGPDEKVAIDTEDPNHPGVLPHMRENPGRPNPLDDPKRVQRAGAVYEEWHKKAPHNASVFDTGCDGDDVMVCVGKANNIVYRSGKWEKGQKKNDYIHTFDSHPKVWMLKHLVAGNKAEAGLQWSGEKTVNELLRGQHRDVAELAAPLSFTLADGTNEGTEVAIHAGSKVHGSVDHKTVLIADPHWRLIIIRGGEMYFDERGIVK